MSKRLNGILRHLNGPSLTRRPAGKRGQSLVEMALTTPILIMMILGLVEIGFVANNYLILMDAVRSGGRAAVNLDPTSWKYGDARNRQRLDCDEDKNSYALLLGTANTNANGSRSLVYDVNGVPIIPVGRAQNLTALGYFNVTASDEPFGFFDEVACQTIYAMQPLQYNDDDTVSKDDVVVSAVSFTLMSYGNGANKLVVDSPGSGYNAKPGSRNNTWVTVTGRWPLENRFCGSYTGSTWNFGDKRDPFDYLTNDINTAWTTGAADNGTIGSNTLVTEGINYTSTGAYDANNSYVLSAGNNQWVRGYTMSAHNRNVVLPNGSAGADNCYGSAFRVQDIEERLNLDATFNPDVPNGGLVIVEIFWQHHPLFFGPLFQGFTGNPVNDPVLHVWGWFPVPSVESTATPQGGPTPGP